MRAPFIVVAIIAIGATLVVLPLFITQVLHRDYLWISQLIGGITMAFGGVASIPVLGAAMQADAREADAARSR